MSCIVIFCAYSNRVIVAPTHSCCREFQELYQRLRRRSENETNTISVEGEEDVQELSEGQLWSSVEESELKNKGKIQESTY